MREMATRVATRSSSSESTDSDLSCIHLSNMPNESISVSMNDVNTCANVDDDLVDEVGEIEPLADDSPSLFLDSDHTIQDAIGLLMRFAISASLDKYRTDQLLKLVKSLMPSPNHLPTRHSRILKQFGRCTMFSTKYLCRHCNSSVIACNEGHNRKKCSNPLCDSSRSPLRSNEVTEIVTLDIRSALSSILTRNIALLQAHEDLFPRSDPINYDVYRQHRSAAQGGNSVSDSLDTFFPDSCDRLWVLFSTQASSTATMNTITLILHADGAPLIRTTKQSLWPCFASIIELPPPCREYQQNIMTIALWSSCKKPDVELFMGEALSQIETLISSGTTIFVGTQEFRIFVRIQCFIADMPAKSLLLKFINFNGRNACCHCHSPGEII